MAKYIAFLRAINVGGHNKVKMDDLRNLFESLQLSNVETFINSGNVLFDSKAKDKETLEEKIEKALFNTFGFEIKTFIRTADELSDIAGYVPFNYNEADTESAHLVIGFLSEVPPPDSENKLQPFRTETDDFRVYGKEVYWLCRTGFSDSKFSAAKLEKVFGMQATFRNSSTILKLIQKTVPPGSR
ncbi:MAG TPA: DUF1697 domain-containing protein [Ignavibacteriales bacterium]|nr:DUF1697 domain-containing protein [Ignavibacteriales bacterium]